MGLQQSKSKYWQNTFFIENVYFNVFFSVPGERVKQKPILLRISKFEKQGVSVYELNWWHFTSAW